MERPPFDPVRGAFAILFLVVLGSLFLGIGVEIGCIYGIADLCSRGAGLKEVIGDIVALVALMLGASRKGPPSE